MNRFYRIVIAYAFSLVLLGCNQHQTQFTNVDITGSEVVAQFALPDTEGKTRTIEDFKGKVTLVFFGFTQCPDVCPTTLAEAVQIKAALGKDADKFQAVFITIDPERDSAEVLRGYVKNFDPTFVALRPESAAQLAEVAKNFRIYYKKTESKSGAANAYSMDHTAASYIFDKEGRVRLFTRYDPSGKGTPALTKDIQQLIAGK